MEISNNLLGKVKKQHDAFRLTHLYEHKFPANLTNIEMSLDDIVAPQRMSHKWDYHLQRLKLKGSYSNDLTKGIRIYYKYIKHPRNDIHS